MMRKLFALAALLIAQPVYAQGFNAEPLPPLVQATGDSATVTATWFHTPNQNWTVDYIWRVWRGTGLVLSGSTTEKTTVFKLPREEADVQYAFEVAVRRLSPSPRTGAYRGESFVVPARELAAVYVHPAPTTQPVIVPHDPVYQLAQGTIWLEFTPDRTTGNQGLWSKDASGYDTGGHLSIMISDGQLRVRIQSDVASHEIIGGTVVDSALNQAAFVWGDNGMRLYLNGSLVGSNAYNGGIQNNTRDAAIGALTWDVGGSTPGPWSSPLVGTMEAVEVYDGVYDFSGRWGEVPIPPPSPVDSLKIEVAQRRIWFAPDGQTALIQFAFVPVTYRPVDYRIGQTENFYYEVWVSGTKAGYTADANYGTVECWRAGSGEVCPVRPFRQEYRQLGLSA